MNDSDEVIKGVSRIKGVIIALNTQETFTNLDRKMLLVNTAEKVRIFSYVWIFQFPQQFTNSRMKKIGRRAKFLIH